MAGVFSSGWSCDLPGGVDTIVAPATAAGSAALAVIRVSGSGVGRVCELVCPTLDRSQERRAQLVTIRDPKGERLERGVVIPYLRPRSYTGEDLLEFIVHGSPYLVGEVVAACVCAGCRMAEPGEFTRRAVANGKMDLVQAEGVADLVRAQSREQARLARMLTEGELSAQLRSLHDGLVGLSARIEAAIDFVGQGIDLPVEEAGRLCQEWLAQADRLQRTGRAGERIRRGVRVVIAGPRNSGKSTLFNHLLQTERAIVGAAPGTTRDLLEAEVEIAGMQVFLVDTAGFGECDDPVEAEGMRRSRAAIAAADVVVLLEAVGEMAAPTVATDARCLKVLSKVDLLAEQSEATEQAMAEGWLGVSVVSGAGLGEFHQALTRAVSPEVAELGGLGSVNLRQRLALERAIAEVRACPLDIPEVAAEGLRMAQREIAGLIGEISCEAVLDQVFGSFCLGK